MTNSHRCTLHGTLLMAAMLTACASGGAPRGANRAAADLIVGSELEQGSAEDLLTLIQRLRPAWLQPRAPVSAQSPPTIVVVLDGVPQEPGVAPLRGFKVGDVREVRRLSAADATTRFGTGMTGGAILVYTKRRDPAR